MVAPAPYYWRPKLNYGVDISTINTHSPLFPGQYGLCHQPLATDSAMQLIISFRKALFRAGRRGQFLSSLSRLNSPFALEDNYYEYVLLARNYH